MPQPLNFSALPFYCGGITGNATKTKCQLFERRVIDCFNVMCLRVLGADVLFAKGGERRLWRSSLSVMGMNVKMKGLAHC
jgi:hypothetical protein